MRNDAAVMGGVVANICATICFSEEPASLPMIWRATVMSTRQWSSGRISEVPTSVRGKLTRAFARTTAPSSALKPCASGRSADSATM